MVAQLSLTIVLFLNRGPNQRALSETDRLDLRREGLGQLRCECMQPLFLLEAMRIRPDTDQLALSTT